MSQELTVISASRALVPVSDARRAAMDAIAEVEDRRRNGRPLSGQRYSRAFFRHLSGAGRASGQSLLRAGIMWEPRRRMTSISEYVHALNVLLESHGLHCPLPLSGSVRQQLFPEYCFALDDRREKRRALSMHAAARREASQAAREYMLLQGRAGQAAAELNFCTPVTVGAWYSRWEDLPDELLEGAFWRWMKRFPSLRPLQKSERMGIPLWYVMSDTADMIALTPQWLKATESGFCPNRIASGRPASVRRTAKA